MGMRNFRSVTISFYWQNNEMAFGRLIRNLKLINNRNNSNHSYNRNLFHNL